MSDLRLDYIANIRPQFHDKMRKMRDLFIELDAAVQEIEELEGYEESGAIRTLSIARTSLEASCMYTVKSLSLIGEVKTLF